MTPAQQADASRNGISLNLRSGSAAAKPPPRPGRRLLVWGGFTLGVLAMLAGGAWYSQSHSGDQAPINVASAAPISNSKTVNPADVPAAEVLAAAPAAAINDEAPASPKGMPGADAEPAPKAGADVLSKALETPSLAAAKPVDAPGNGGQLAPAPELKKTPAKPQPQPQRRAKPKSTKPDSDVTLLAALMAHAQANPESKKTAPRVQAQLQQCQKMSSPAAEKCHVRVCAGRTKTHAECKPVKVAGTGAA